MKIRPILSLMLLLAVTSSSKATTMSNADNDVIKHHDGRPDHNKAVKGDNLFIKEHGLVCDKLKVCNLLAGGQLSFNNKGCNTLLAKGTKEKNLLNLRSTFCLGCNPGLSCSLNNDCTTNGTPAVGCLNLSSSLANNRVKLCSGEGIGTDKATVCISGTSCQNHISIFPEGELVEIALSLSLTSNVQIEVLIPLFFCLPFCDRPTLHVTYNDKSCDFKQSICVKNKPIDDEPIIDCTVLGQSVTTFLGTQVDLRNITRSTAFLAFTLRYQNCIGLAISAEVCPEPIDAANQVACTEQKKAIVEICKHANTLLKNACFDVKAEGQAL